MSKGKTQSPSASVEVRMPDGSIRLVTKLLTIPEERREGKVNKKLYVTNKREKEFFVVGLSLAPADSSGYEVCASRSPGCTEGCLAGSGFGYFFPNIPLGRIAKTRLFFEKREVFLTKLFHELHANRRKVATQGKRLAVRLNVFSDLVWEKIVPEIFTTFDDVVFYDYTKHFKRYKHFLSGDLPPNYYLTFSRSEKNKRESRRVLKLGGNLAVPFRGVIPAEYLGFPVIDGDESDLRFKDPKNVVIGLKAKGPKGKRDKTGFVVRLPLTVLSC